MHYKFQTHRAVWKKQAGLTMIEALVVVAVLGIVISLGLMFFGGLRDNVNASGEQRLFMTAAENVRGTLQTQSTYVAATTANAVSNQWFPKEKISGTAIVNDWGGSITVAPANCNGTNDCFVITSADMPGDICKKTLPKLDAVAKIITATPDGGAATTVKALNGAMDFGNVGTGCGDTSTTIAVTFGKT